MDDALEETAFASGTALRKALKDNRDDQVLRAQLSYVRLDEEEYQNDWSSYWPLLKSIILRSTDEEMRAIYQMEEGIENRLKEVIRTTSSIEECLQQLKNKTVELGKVATTSRLCFTWCNQKQKWKTIGVVRLSKALFLALLQKDKNG